MPFTEEQAPYFFGRDRERDVIAANLMASRLTLFYGPSGVGKSSVLNAGVVHYLRELERDALASTGRSQYVILHFRDWRDEPLAHLERVIEKESGAAGQGPTFADRLHSLAERVEGDILIILDQFEEYFMYHPNEQTDGTFAVEFARAINRRGLRANFLVSMREDSIAKLDFFKGRIPNLFDNYLRIARLTRDQAREAIVRPIERFNQLSPSRPPVSIEPALVEAVLDQVKANTQLHEDAGKGGLQGDAEMGIETPHLQLVMTRLWQEEVSAQSSVLRLGTLERLGGASEIVKRHVDSALDALTPTERDAAARVFQYLVTPAGTKIALGVDDLYPNAGMTAADLRALLVKLSSGENRILTSVAPAPDQPARERYQIFHDVLAEKVLDWRSRYVKAAEAQAAKAVADEERRRAEKEARAATRLRYLLALTGMFFVVATMFAWFAWRQSQAAKAATVRADKAALEADNANHSAEARRLELLKADALRVELEAKNESLDLERQAAEARFKGQTDAATQLAQKAQAATARAVSSKADADRYGAEQVKEQQAADRALAAAAQIQTTPALYPTDTAPLPGGTATLPSTSPTPGPVIPTTTPAPTPTNTPTTQPTNAQATGDYREVYRKAIDAKNRKRWDEAAKLFKDALALRGTDNGERINISGFGNIEPYVPHFYLGVAQMNLKDCQAAMVNWNISEKDGSIQKTSLYGSLKDYRAQCSKY